MRWFRRRKKDKEPALSETPEPGGAKAGGFPLGVGASVPPPEKKEGS